jgi:phosphoglycolate phosphatase
LPIEIGGDALARIAARERDIWMKAPSCNLCGSTEFVDMKSRRGAQCAKCKSLERTRVLHLFLSRFDIVRPGMRVMHLAPELGLYSYLSNIPDVQYEAYDLSPQNFGALNVRRLDLVTGLAGLPSRSYDVIIHSHVMEHIPCNVTAVLFHLNRLLKDDGEQLCVIPFVRGNYGEFLGPMEEAERVRLYGQRDHVRRFGVEDMQTTVGMIFRLPAGYDLEEMFGAELLDSHNIPRAARRGFTGHTVLRLKRSDMILRDDA